jgi:hypothetical protein
MKKVIRELRDWRDYAPAAFWAILALALAVAAPLCVKFM